jgi:hypothetical protein
MRTCLVALASCCCAPLCQLGSTAPWRQCNSASLSSPALHVHSTETSTARGAPPVLADNSIRLRLDSPGWFVGWNSSMHAIVSYERKQHACNRRPACIECPIYRHAAAHVSVLHPSSISPTQLLYITPHWCPFRAVATSIDGHHNRNRWWGSQRSAGSKTLHTASLRQRTHDGRVCHAQ